MRDQTFDALTARAASLSRRASILGLGGAALVAVARPAPVRASKVGKRARRKCRRQIGKCEESATTFCAQIVEQLDLEVCEALFQPCCQSFSGCHARAAYDCLFAAVVALGELLPV